MATPPTASRPKMQNYGIESSLSGMLAWDWVETQLEKARSYWVSSTRPDGLPHAAPIWGVWHDGALYFGSDTASRKVRNFAHQPSVVLHLESGDEVVILEGQVVQFDDQVVLETIGKAYAVKYGVDPIADTMPGSAFFRFTPQTGLSWLEKDFPTTATRWAFRSAASGD